MDATLLQTEWGWQIALYLFLGGLAAGTMVVTGLITLRDKADALHKTVRFGAWAALVCLAVGLLCLISEVRMPLRAMMVWQSFTNFGSWMAIGAWLLVAGGVAGLVFALAETDAVADKATWLVKARKPMAYVAIVLGACIAAYTGILLSVLVAHPLWNTPLLPVLFTVSALDTGVALIVGYAVLREKESPVRAKAMGLLEKGTIVLVAVEVVVLAAMLALVASGSEIGALSVATLATGVLAVPFWVLFVACGLALPFATALVAAKGGTPKAKPVAATEEATALASMPAPKLKLAVTGEAAATAPAVEADPVPKPKLTRAQGFTLAGAAGVLMGGCALRFLILLAGLPLWA